MECGGCVTPELHPPVLAAVRRTVRGLLEASPGWHDADPTLRHNVAHSLVSVGMMAADLAATELPGPAPVAQALDAPPPQPQFAAAKNAAQTVADLRKALD